MVEVGTATRDPIAARPLLSSSFLPSRVSPRPADLPGQPLQPDQAGIYGRLRHVPQVDQAEGAGQGGRVVDGWGCSHRRVLF